MMAANAAAKKAADLMCDADKRSAVLDAALLNVDFCRLKAAYAQLFKHVGWGVDFESAVAENRRRTGGRTITLLRFAEDASQY